MGDTQKRYFAFDLQLKVIDLIIMDTGRFLQVRTGPVSPRTRWENLLGRTEDVYIETYHTVHILLPKN